MEDFNISFSLFGNDKTFDEGNAAEENKNQAKKQAS